MIVVGYSANQYGDAALEHAIAEATLRSTSLLVVNSSKGDALVDATFAPEERVESVEALLDKCGVEYELVQPIGVTVTDALLDAMRRDDAELLVIGIRHRTAVGKFLLGSNAQQLIMNCPKPILAVKP